MIRRRWILAGAWLALVPLGSVAGQQVERGQSPAPARRAQVQQRLAQVVQQRLRLNGEQMSRLRETTDRFATQRQTLIAQERDARRGLRAALALAPDSTNQAEVGRRLDDLVRLQQRRASLLGDEQRELARFLTPRQRADFLALQERALRAAQQLRQRRANDPQP